MDDVIDGIDFKNKFNDKYKKLFQMKTEGKPAFNEKGGFKGVQEEEGGSGYYVDHYKRYQRIVGFLERNGSSSIKRIAQGLKWTTDMTYNELTRFVNDGRLQLVKEGNRNIYKLPDKLKDLEGADNVTKEKNTCERCDNEVWHTQRICNECKEKEEDKLFQDKLLPRFKDKERLSTKDIRAVMKMNSDSELSMYLSSITERGLVEKTKEGNKNFYSLPASEKQEESKSYEFPERPPLPRAKCIVKFPEDQTSQNLDKFPLSKAQEKEETKIIGDLSNLAIEKLPCEAGPGIQLINSLLPELFKSKEFTVQPGYEKITVQFLEQKPLLDLYETLPNNLKGVVEIRLSPVNPIQEIVIPIRSDGK